METPTKRNKLACDRRVVENPKLLFHHTYTHTFLSLSHSRATRVFEERKKESMSSGTSLVVAHCLRLHSSDVLIEYLLARARYAESVSVCVLVVCMSECEWPRES